MPPRCAPRRRPERRDRSCHRQMSEIVQMSSELESDLIILGSHGRHGFQRFLLGSVAEYVLRYAAVSVLIVPASASRAEASGEHR
jgi:hypothetical protein